MPICPSCLSTYPTERQALGYSTCIKCTTTNHYKAGIHYAHKTAGEIDVMSSKQWIKHKRVTNRIGKHSSNMSRTARYNTGYTI